MRLEIRRKLGHVLFGLFLGYGYFYGLFRKELFIAYFCMMLVMVISYTLTRSWKYPLFGIFFMTFDRQSERRRRIAGNGAIAYWFSFLAVVYLFPVPIAAAAIITLSFGDPVAQALGIRFGKVPCPWNGKKDLDARIYTSFLLMLMLFPLLPWWHAFLGALAGMLIESVETKIFGIRLDDNLSVPLVSGLVFWLLSLL